MQIVMLISEYCIGLNSLNMFFFHNDISRQLQTTLFCIEITFIIFERLILKFLTWLYSRVGQTGFLEMRCESTNKTSKLFYCQFLVSLLWCRIFHNVFIFYELVDRLPFFWVNDKTHIFHYFGWYELVFICIYYKDQFLKQIYCFCHSKEILFKALIYSNYVILRLC